MPTEPGAPRRSFVGGEADQDDDAASAPSSDDLRGGARRAMTSSVPAKPHEPASPPDPVPIALPRRAVAPEEHRETTASRLLRPWIVAVGAGFALAVMVLTLYLVRGAAPTTTQPESAPPTASSTNSPRPDQTDKTQSATTAGPPLDSTTPQGEVSPAQTAAPSGPVDLTAIQLDDAEFALPGGWELYADDVVDGSRRLVRIREPLSDVRAQLVSLTSIGTDLSGACQALIDDQGGNYSNMVPVLPAAIGLTSTEGTGVTCGFRGTRASDAQDNSVTFTLLQRTSDSHSLVLRSTIPASVSADAPASTALFGVNCQASSSFGVPLPLC